MVRPNGFATLEQRNADFPLPVFSGTLDDWFTHPEVNTLSTSESTAGGFAATVTEFVIERSDDSVQDCGPPPEDQCIFLLTTPDPSQATIIRLRTGEAITLWEIDQGDNDPLVAIVVTIAGDDEAGKESLPWQRQIPAPRNDGRVSNNNNEGGSFTMSIDELFRWIDEGQVATARGFYCGVAVVNDVRNSEPVGIGERTLDYSASGQGTLRFSRDTLSGRFKMTFSDRVVVTGSNNNDRRPRFRGETGDIDEHEIAITRGGEVFVRLVSWSDTPIKVEDVDFRGGYLTGFFENRGKALLAVSFDQAEFIIIR